jgi:DNA repair protein RadC
LGYVAERSAPPLADSLGVAITGPDQIVPLFRKAIPDNEGREHFLSFPLNTRNVPLGAYIVSVGTVNCSIVHPREVFRVAVIENAASVIIAHNHPSGDPTPSEEDLAITRRLQEAGRLLGIEVLDHVIIGRMGSFVSMKEKRIL